MNIAGEGFFFWETYFSALLIPIIFVQSLRGNGHYLLRLFHVEKPLKQHLGHRTIKLTQL